MRSHRLEEAADRQTDEMRSGETHGQEQRSHVLWWLHLLMGLIFNLTVQNHHFIWVTITEVQHCCKYLVNQSINGFYDNVSSAVTADTVNLTSLVVTPHKAATSRCVSDLWECVCQINSPPTVEPQAIPDLVYWLDPAQLPIAMCWMWHWAKTRVEEGGTWIAGGSPTARCR